MGDYITVMLKLESDSALLVFGIRGAASDSWLLRADVVHQLFVFHECLLAEVAGAGLARLAGG